MPDVDIKPDIKNNKCLNLKKMLFNCCKNGCLDNDTCLSSFKSSCCIVNNITNNTFESPPITQKRELKKNNTSHI